MPTLLDDAMTYVEKGWAVLPLHAPVQKKYCTCGRDCGKNIGKHPRTPRGVQDATREPGVIQLWFADMWQNANLGIATGSASKFFALDIDPRNGGSESLAELVHSHSKIPDTVQTITGSGGQHLWFQMPEWNVRNITLAPGINIRGDGGYIVVPHSLHVSGSHYEFDLFSHPDRVPIAPAPDWLLKLLYERAHSGRSLSDEFTLDKIPRTLPRSAWHILKGTSRRHYETRSEAEQAAITAMVNAGFTLDAIRDAFEQYAHDGTHYRHEIKNRGRVQAEHWLKHSYQNAVAFVQHNTTPEARAAEERAAKRRAWALSTPWEGRSGPTQLKVAL